MDANKNHSHDAEGLQAVEQDNFPEVVPGSQKLPSRRNSMTSPEPYNTSAPQPYNPDRQQQWPQNEKGTYAPVPTSDYQGQHPPGSSPPQYSDYGMDKQQQFNGEQTVPQERKILGMRRKVFFWVAAVVIFLIIIAAVLGGVLGTVLNDDSDSSSKNGNSTTGNNSTTSGEFQMKDKSGLAILSGDDGLYTYYMNEAGSIVETNFGSDWNKNNTALPSTMNVTTGADPSSPIAAITYTLQGSTTYRQIFYFDSEGILMTVNTTGDTWDEAYAPIANGLSSKQGTIALAAVAATGNSAEPHLNGIRVYFGSSDNVIQEIGCDFTSSNPVWNVWANFTTSSDATSGVSTVVVGQMNHLYFRNATTGALEQYLWNYADPKAWLPGASSSDSNGVVEGGSIAAATDGSNTDYIFYQTSDTSTVVAQYSGSGSSIDAPSSSVQSIQSAPLGYALAATYSTSAGAVVLNQNSQATSQLLFSSVSRSGESQEYSTETGSGS